MRKNINFLIGIARKRHHSHVRNSPWATFFYGVKSAKNFPAASLPANIAAPVSTATGGPAIRARFFVSGGDATELLEPGEAALDQMPFLIEVLV